MAYQKVDLTRGISLSFNLLKFMGNWRTESGKPSTIMYYKIYSITIVSIFLIMFLITELINIIESQNDLEQITEASFLFVTHVSQTIKFSQFVLNMNRIQRMIDGLNQPLFQPRNRLQAERLQWYISLARYTFHVDLGMSLGTVAVWAVMPLLHSGDDEWPLPLSSWFPFRTDRSGTYQVGYVYQVISASVNACTNLSMDICVTAFMILLGGELDLLNDTLTNLRLFALERIKLRGGDTSKLEDESNYEDLPETLEQEMEIIFVECVHHHKTILGFAKDIGTNFNYCVLSLFTIGVVIICVTMFQLTLVEQFSLQFFSMVMYQSCMLLEILLYCWFGNEIIVKSSEIATSIYSSDWLRTSISYRRKLLIMMTRVQVPIRIYAANLFMLSVPTFAAILKTSWSYFAVLQTMHSKE